MVWIPAFAGMTLDIAILHSLFWPRKGDSKNGCYYLHLLLPVVPNMAATGSRSVMMTFRAVATLNPFFREHGWMGSRQRGAGMTTEVAVQPKPTYLAHTLCAIFLSNSF